LNRHLPHLAILPEDEDDAELANGFVLNEEVRRVHVLPYSGGWHKVRDEFEERHIKTMERLPERRMILLIDFDRQTDRLAYMKEAIPAHLETRVFVLGCWNEPKDLKQAFAGRGSLEDIGSALGRECIERNRDMWEHPLLAHNAEELRRLSDSMRDYLIGGN